MTKIIQRSKDRGTADHGWLKANFSFSFSNYYNPKRNGFGKLLVLNDDTISPQSGFGTHPHENMEIITIPTKGELTHKDSTGSEEVIKPGQIQVMSAGSGILHSEYNNSDEETKLFQIWIETSKQDVSPRHETKTLNIDKNKLAKIVSGNEGEDTLFIYQDAAIYLGEFEEENIIEYSIPENKGIFLMVVEGKVAVDNDELNKRDSIEISKTDKVKFKFKKGTKVLLIEVPVN